MKRHLVLGILLACSSLLMAQPQAGSFSITPKVSITQSTLMDNNPSMVLCSYNQIESNLPRPDSYEANLRCKTQSVQNICFGLEL